MLPKPRADLKPNTADFERLPASSSRPVFANMTRAGYSRARST